MRLGLYGGSFDPIHYGHLRPVREARQALELDRVVYLPTAQPPHKDREMAPPEARYSMVELALLEEEGCFASAFEMRSDAAYTIDTLRHFRRCEPGVELFLIVGGDSFAALPAWREWRRILELAQIAVLERPGTTLFVEDLSAEDLAPELRDAIAAKRAHLVSNVVVHVSSTEVRRAVASAADNLTDLVPELVLDYIEKYRLYRGRTAQPSPT
ncbi:MAG: nicotinate-nucleotide adenylyltransferase [Thermoanaerobaculia bacterium]